MDFDPSSAEPVTAVAEPGFDPSSAEPIVAPKGENAQHHNEFSLNEQEFAKASPIGRLKMILSHPWDKYVASVDQGFKGPEIPRVEADKGVGVVNRAGQVGAAVDNTLAGAASGLITPGAAASVVSPATIVYSAPRFIAGGIENIIDAVKGSVSGEADLQQTTEKALGGALMVAGGAHGLKTGAKAAGLSAEVAPKTPTEAIDIIKAQADKTTDPNAKAALDAAAVKISDSASKGAAFDPTTAEPVAPVEPFDATTAKSAAGPSDYEQYQAVHARMGELIKSGDINGPEFMDLFRQNEVIKNRNQDNPGMPPEAPPETPALDPGQGTTNFDLSAPENTKQPPVIEPSATPEATAMESVPNYGIAQRVSDVRTEQGHIPPIEPGVGISAEDSVAHGRDLLETGRNPQAAIDDFKRTGAISADGVALTRARGEELAKSAYEALKKHGKDSPEYKAAAEADANWVKEIKPMQTEWHKIGQAQQGETEVDTGNFHGLSRAYTEATGKDFTPAQAEQASVVAGKVQAATDAAEAAKAKVLEVISKEVPQPRPRGSKIVRVLSERADAARARIKARMAEGRVSSGLDPLELKDYAEVAAYHLARGVEAGVELIKEFGEKIRPHLDEILAKARETMTEDKANFDTSVAGIWERAKRYIDAGETNYDDLRHKIAIDLGIPVEEVTKKLAEPKNSRSVTNEMYAKLAARRDAVRSAQNWLQNQKTPGWLRFINSIPRAFFAAKVFGHGTVGMITHAGLNIFHPEAWASYWPNFFRQFKLIGWHDKGAYHEMMMENLTRDPNYVTARRAGLANDPMRYTDDYQDTRLGGFLRKLGLTGNRGFDALKLFRQDRFNQIWDSMPESLRTSDNAKLIADSINHATGVVRARFREWANWTFFAPKLEGSRWAWMIGDPLKAAKTLSSWDKSTPEEQQFALREVKQKATITGVYLSLLALNQGLLKAAGSSQQINFTDPSKADFLAFKGFNHRFGVVGPMLGIVRLFANLLHASIGKPTPAESRDSRASRIAVIAEKYGRGKLSPFAGFATDVAAQSDFQGRPLPFSNDKVPAYLRREGIGKYGYGEFAAQEFTPIPVSEAVREVWRKQGMDESTIAHWMKALSSAVIMGGTGARMSPDFQADKKK